MATEQRKFTCSWESNIESAKTEKSTSRAKRITSSQHQCAIQGNLHNLEKCASETEELVLLVKCSSHKSKDLNLHPQNPYKKSSVLTCACSPRLTGNGTDRRILGLTGQSRQQVPGSTERLCLKKKKRWRVTEIWLPFFLSFLTHRSVSIHVKPTVVLVWEQWKFMWWWLLTYDKNNIISSY